MSLFKKRKDSSPATPQFADDDPNSPLRKLPLDAQKEFMASSLTKDEVIKEWDIFMQCIYFQCRTAFEKAPPEVLKKRGQLAGSAPAATTETQQRTLDPNNRPVLTRKRSGTCPAIFPSESDKADLENNTENKEEDKKEENDITKVSRPKRDRSISEKDPTSDGNSSDRKRAKSSAKGGRESKDISPEDDELRKVTHNKRSVSALKERDVKNREDKIKIEIIDSISKSSSDGKIKTEKKSDPAVDSIKIDETSRKDSSGQLDLKASTSSEKGVSGSEEKKKDETTKPSSLTTSNNSLETVGDTFSNATAPPTDEAKGSANNTPRGSPRESPKGDKATGSIGSDLLVKTSSSERLKDKSKRKRHSKNIEVDIVTEKVLVITEDHKSGSKSTPGSPAPEKKHKKRSSSSTSKKDKEKDKDKNRSKTPEKDRATDEQKSKLKVIPETKPLDIKEEEKKEKARRKSEGQMPNKIEKAPITLINGDPVDSTKSQNEGNVMSNSTSKTTSVGTSTGTGKKKRSTSITLTEEELNQIFIKSNPKDYYSISHKIGKGAFATVHIGKSLAKADKHKRVAIKVATLNADKDKEKDPKKKSKANINLIANEIRLLNSCQHSNIVKHLGSYSYKDQIWTVMEYCDGGTLKDLLRVQLNENHIAFVLRDIISAVSYLHERKRIHRDLKSDNILLNVNADVKIADLGLSIELDEADDDSEVGIAGSRFWLAPEMIRGDGYGVKADIWSLGCVAVEMADGRPPNYTYHPLKAIFYTATKGFTGLRQNDKWSPSFRDFLARCFESDPSKRATAAELSQHAFLKTASSRREMAEMLKMAFMLKVTEGLEY